MSWVKERGGGGTEPPKIFYLERLQIFSEVRGFVVPKVTLTFIFVNDLRLRMLAVWSNDGSFKILAEIPEIDGENSMDEEEEEDGENWENDE